MWTSVFVKVISELEGDGPLALECYETIVGVKILSEREFASRIIG